jgi:hypothetical protein
MQDNLGIPRCLSAEVDCTTQDFVGAACASAADCCGLPCLPNLQAADPPFVCGATCAPAGGACTTTADCCAGLPCVIPTGSAVGECGAAPPPDAGTPCSEYGQSCVTAADCCNDVPCTQTANGLFCVFPLR